MRALPKSYFDLPPKKRELPDVPQDLTPRLRKMFPFCPRDNDDFKDHIVELRKVYAFRYLPNDYLIRKKRLPDSPEELHLKEKFEFPIMSEETALRFLEAIPSFYRITTPLPKSYIGINYTSLKDLPAKPEEVEEVNLTVPIKSTKELMIAVKALREHYFFWKIQDTWIQIENKDKDKDKLLGDFPTNIADLNRNLQERNIVNCPKFPITEQEEVSKAINLLYETYNPETIPDWVFDLKELPAPSWNIFGKEDDRPNDREDIGMVDNFEDEQEV